MRAIIIGGSGHVGTYLVPRLVESGYEVINISRGNRKPYRPHAVWSQVEQITLNRSEKESAGTFGREIVKLKPDIVIDMICFTEPSAKQLVEALRGNIRHFLHCGTIWVHGHSAVVPTTENQPRQPFGEYGIQKAAIETYLLHEARQNGFPVTILHPGHIVGPGWPPLNPAGHFNLDAFQQLAAGKSLTLPNLGMETVHHVHADDVAQAFMKAVEYWSTATGESFHVVSPKALTLRGYAEAISAWFGKTPDLEFLPWEKWRTTVTPEDAEMTWDHIAHSPNCSIQKARRLIDYNPRYSSLEAVYEALEWIIAHDKIKVP
ncbi:MAG: NAD(P)-dependent oxidoreductase [Candidatus Latescibacteria bacterium]|nr:NAD(P)-dependent oxidoreductase [Candidatus Latescibacterota bacterium]